MISPIHIYIENMSQTSMNMFGSNTKLNKPVRPPLEQGGRSELDTSELLDNEYTQKY